jgi:tetratricopeptide (TPR) repeat protein
MWWLAACLRTAPVSPSPTPDAPGTEGPTSPSRVGSAEARAFYLRAVSAHAAGQDDQALLAAEWVLRLGRGDVWAQLRVAELLLELAPARAVEPARAALALAERRPEALPQARRALGLALLASGEGEAALPLLEQASGLPGVEGALARARLQLGDVLGAQAVLARWSPSSPSEALERARLLPEQGSEVAMELLDHPALGPRALSVLLELRGGRATAAARCDLSALHRWAVEHAHLAEQPAFWPGLAEVARQTADEALAARLAAISGRPAPAPPESPGDGVDRWVEQARVYRLAGQVEQERAALQEALALSPCRPEVLVRLSELTSDPCLRSRAASVRTADPALQDLPPCEEVH